jgi:hypothetical protein
VTFTLRLIAVLTVFLTVFLTARFAGLDTPTRLTFFLAGFARFLVAVFARFAGDFLRGLDFDTLLTFLRVFGILGLDNRENPSDR